MTQHVLQSRTHDWLLWLLPLTARWPKRLRAGLTARLESEGVALLADLAEAEARRGRARAEALRRADGRLAAVKALFRLAHDLGLVSAGTQEHGAALLAEMGRLLGGWMRAQATVETDPSAPSSSSALASAPAAP